MKGPAPTRLLLLAASIAASACSVSPAGAGGGAPAHLAPAIDGDFWTIAGLDPLDFGVDDDSHLVESLPVAAPEVFEHEGQWYLATLLPSLTGIRVARLAWR